MFSHFVQVSPIKEAIFREEGLMIERIGVMSLLLILMYFSSACPSLLYFALQCPHFLLQGVDTCPVSRKLCSEKFPSDQFVALLRNGFRAKAPSPNFAQGKKCLFITLAYISGLFVSVTSINFKPNSQMDFLKLFIMNHD